MQSPLVRFPSLRLATWPPLVTLLPLSLPPPLAAWLPSHFGATLLILSLQTPVLVQALYTAARDALQPVSPHGLVALDPLPQIIAWQPLSVRARRRGAAGRVASAPVRHVAVARCAAAAFNSSVRHISTCVALQAFWLRFTKLHGQSQRTRSSCAAPLLERGVGGCQVWERRREHGMESASNGTRGSTVRGGALRHRRSSRRRLPVAASRTVAVALRATLTSPLPHFAAPSLRKPSFCCSVTAPPLEQSQSLSLRAPDRVQAAGARRGAARLFAYAPIAAALRAAATLKVSWSGTQSVSVPVRPLALLRPSLPVLMVQPLVAVRPLSQLQLVTFPPRACVAGTFTAALYALKRLASLTWQQLIALQPFSAPQHPLKLQPLSVLALQPLVLLPPVVPLPLVLIEPCIVLQARSLRLLMQSRDSHRRHWCCNRSPQGCCSY